MKSSFKQEIQTFGRSLLLPIAVLAPVGMLMGVSSALGQSYMVEQLPFLGSEGFKALFTSLKTIAGVIFSNIPLLFAMGVAYGMSKKEKGIAVFASVIAYLTLLITMKVSLTLTGDLATGKLALAGQGMILGIHTLKIEALGGIIAGLIAAKVTDRFYRLQLPLAFAFFSGKKSVAIISIAVTMPVGLIIPFIWEWFTAAMISLSGFFMYEGVGMGAYWTLNRLLIPFGLHHVLSSMLRFTEAGGIYMIDGVKYVGILPAMNHVLFELGPNHPAWKELMPTLGGYLASGQMLTTLFRIPAIGLAMYHTAFTKNKKFARGIILTVVLTAFLGNVTEPLEFSFLFIAPVLFVVYAVLSGLLAIPLYFLDVSIGYIRGTIFDFGIFGLMYENTQWISLILVGIVNFVVFYGVFRYAIVKFKIATPGREQDVGDNTLLLNKEYDKIAELVIEGLGGKGNIVRVENCVTRLRIDFKDKDLLDVDKFKAAGSAGTFFPSGKHIHIVFGPHVEFVRNSVDDHMNGVILTSKMA
ncbi:PTS transporter subunit EIIC [Vibrio sp. 1180_3]|uniref:PTS transporter subunit EIIC n=1 Tax=Vibrio sp. 1180_3 TaxID=2528832 RepID=UPI002405883F|nr:PTS transporter subunit EIIC [Vibrio sp. 1180_3]MDF9399725.1 PTS trehalose transporter subunit IIC [Vibrio sp. 1180_3]